MTKRVFILGAGFSAGANMPLGDELTHLLLKRAREVERDEAFVTRLDALSDLAKTLPDKPPNFEQFFEHAIIWMGVLRSRQQLCPLGRNDGYTPYSQAEDLEYWADTSLKPDLCGILHECQNSAREAPVKRFCEALQPSDAILTFNYDTLVEDALAYLEKPWNHGLEDATNGGTPVYKMHGSLDWELDERDLKRCGLTRLFQKEDSNAVRTGSVPSEETEYHLALYRIFRRLPDKPMQWGGCGIMGFGRFKRLSDLPGSALTWKRAMGAMREAEEITVVGFRLSEFDVLAQLQFLEVLEVRKDAGLDPPVVRVVDPGAACPDFRARYTRVFGQGIEFIEDRMEQHDWA